ncbi:hypothetical protein [Nonomuraea sp. NPDC003201]
MDRVGEFWRSEHAVRLAPAERARAASGTSTAEVRDGRFRLSVEVSDAGRA